MATQYQQRYTFRPAPFAVYPPDRHHGPLARLRTALLIIGTALCLLPAVAGPSSELSLPVYYALIELEDRAPVVLELNLASADYEVQPASLGYFTDDGAFVFSAEVPRGLIYGQHNGELMVIEIVAPTRSGMYTDQQLAIIRENVADINKQENLLRLARRDAPPAPGRAGGLADEFWRKLGPELAGTVPEDWVQTVLDEYSGDLETIDSILIQQARHQARLKRLYYDGQAARLELQLSKFDLQLALARLPKPEMEGLISLGDEILVRRTMLDEISRLKASWLARQTILDHQIVNNLQWLSTTRPDVHSLPGSPVDTLFTPPDPLGGISQLSGAGTPDNGRQRLLEITAQAQLVVAYAEAELIDLRLAEIDDALRHVRKGGLPAWADLPHYAPQLHRLRMAGLEELSAFADAEHAARSPQTAAPLLLALARAFESPAPLDSAAATADDDESAALAGAIQADAVAYGLLVVDRCRRGTGLQSGAILPPSDNADRSLVDELKAITDFPAEYDSAAFNLGFLKFMLWYATLEREQTARVFAPFTGRLGTAAPRPAIDDTLASEVTGLPD